MPRSLLRALSSAVLAASTLTACAPDAVFRNPEFEAWLGEVRQACQTARIGKYTVGGLLQSTGSREGVHFLNQTSRLYAGRIDADEWSRNVSAFILGRPGDPGLQCVLERLPQR